MPCHTAIHLKRLGEAAHGLAPYLNGNSAWVFLDRSNPRQIKVAMTVDKADEIRANPPAAGWVEAEVCGETPSTSPPPALAITVESTAPKTLTFQTAGPAAPGGPPWVDALFFTKSAVKKFVMPYATALYGVDVAQSILNGFGEADIMTHFPPTVFDTTGTDEVAMLQEEDVPGAPRVISFDEALVHALESQ